MTDEELIEELSQLNDALKAENENLKMNNLGLGMQSQILTQSNGEIVSLYTIQGNLLTEALKLSEKFSAEAEAAKKANQIETWFWRIVGLAGAAYGLYQASK